MFFKVHEINVQRLDLKLNQIDLTTHFFIYYFIFNQSLVKYKFFKYYFCFKILGGFRVIDHLIEYK